MPCLRAIRQRSFPRWSPAILNQFCIEGRDAHAALFHDAVEGGVRRFQTRLRRRPPRRAGARARELNVDSLDKPEFTTDRSAEKSAVAGGLNIGFTFEGAHIGVGVSGSKNRIGIVLAEATGT